MNLQERLVKAREKLGLSQAKLAERVGVAVSTVAGWETYGEHHHGIRKDRIVKVAKILGLDVVELLS